MQIVNNPNYVHNCLICTNAQQCSNSEVSWQFCDHDLSKICGSSLYRTQNGAVSEHISFENTRDDGRILAISDLYVNLCSSCNCRRRWCHLKPTFLEYDWSASPSSLYNRVHMSWASVMRTVLNSCSFYACNGVFFLDFPRTIFIEITTKLGAATMSTTPGQMFLYGFTARFEPKLKRRWSTR